MRYRYSDILKGLIGLLLCLTAIAGIYYWETYGRVEFTNKEIVVLKESIKAQTLITESDLVTVKREISTLIEDPIINSHDIVGKVSKHYIPSNLQLSDAYFEEDELFPSDGEYIFQIPSEWIASCPSTLRRSDDAYIYPVIEGSSAEESEITEEEPIKCLKIAFVKNQSNQEVKSVGDSDRLDGTSTISTIEMIATIEDVQLLNQLRAKGYKFLIMYR